VLAVHVAPGDTVAQGQLLMIVEAMKMEHRITAPRAGTVSEVRARRLWKHTLFLVGPALAASGTRSHLYHPGHFHEHRRAQQQARHELRTADTAARRRAQAGGGREARGRDKQAGGGREARGREQQSAGAGQAEREAGP